MDDGRLCTPLLHTTHNRSEHSVHSTPHTRTHNSLWQCTDKHAHTHLTFATVYVVARRCALLYSYAAYFCTHHVAPTERSRAEIANRYRTADTNARVHVESRTSARGRVGRNQVRTNIRMHAGIVCMDFRCACVCVLYECVHCTDCLHGMRETLRDCCAKALSSVKVKNLEQHVYMNVQTDTHARESLVVVDAQS